MGTGTVLSKGLRVEILGRVATGLLRSGWRGRNGLCAVLRKLRPISSSQERAIAGFDLGMTWLALWFRNLQL